MDKYSFDFKSLIDTMILAELVKRKDKESKEMAEILKVFQKHDIGTMEALEILMQFAVIFNKQDG